MATELGQLGDTPSAVSAGATLRERAAQILASARVRTSLSALVVAAAYALAADVGVALNLPAAHISAFWAPNALLLAVLLMSERRSWWVYLLCILPAHLIVLEPLAGDSFARVLVQYAASCATALIGAFGINAAVPGMRRIDTTRTAVAFILVGGILTPALSSVLAAAAYVALGVTRLFWLTVLARTLTDSFAILTLVPLILHTVAWLQQEDRTMRRVRALETTVLVSSLAVLVALAIAVPAVLTEYNRTLLLTLFLVTLWAAVHFGVMGSCASALVLGAVATAGVLKQPVQLSGLSTESSALWLLLVLVCLSATLLLLATALEESRTLQRAGVTSEARLNTMFARNMVPALIWRADGTIASANSAFLQLTGYAPAELTSGAFKVWQLIGAVSEGEPTDSTRAARLFDTDGVPIERSLVLPEGRRIPVLISGCRLPGGTAEEGTACIFDLSALRQVESQRHQAQKLYSAVLTSLHDQILVLDQTGAVIELNAAWRRFSETYGRRSWERAGVGANFLLACEAPDAGDAVAAQLLQAVRDVLAGVAMRRSLEFANDPPGSLWYEVSIEPLQRPEGGAVITRADITANKQAMTQAREQRRQLTHLGRAAVLGELSGAFAHELAQPLTSILGNAEAALQIVLRGQADPGEIAEILRDIIRDDVRAADVIQRLRSMLTHGEAVRQRVDVNQVVRDVLALAHSDLITRNVSCVTALCGPTAAVLADPVQLQQVLLNLVINACEAMSETPTPERRLTITTRVVEEGGAVECAVSDQGGGIKPEYMERIFQPFVTTKQHGMGLGLAICRSIVDAHGGRLRAENVGRGAVFSFTARTGA